MEDLVSIAVARKLKDKGIKIDSYGVMWVNYYYGLPMNKWKLVHKTSSSPSPSEFPTPLKQDLKEYLRKNYGIDVLVNKDNQVTLDFGEVGGYGNIDFLEVFDSEMDALDFGLYEAIKTISV